MKSFNIAYKIFYAKCHTERSEVSRFSRVLRFVTCVQDISVWKPYPLFVEYKLLNTNEISKEPKPYSCGACHLYCSSIYLFLSSQQRDEHYRKVVNCRCVGCYACSSLGASTPSCQVAPREGGGLLQEGLRRINIGNNIAVDLHSEKREDVMSTVVETSRLL